MDGLKRHPGQVITDHFGNQAMSLDEGPLLGTFEALGPDGHRCLVMVTEMVTAGPEVGLSKNELYVSIYADSMAYNHHSDESRLG